MDEEDHYRNKGDLEAVATALDGARAGECGHTAQTRPQLPVTAGKLSPKRAALLDPTRLLRVPVRLQCAPFVPSARVIARHRKGFQVTGLVWLAVDFRELCVG